LKNLSPATTDTYTVEENVQVTVLPNGLTVATAKRPSQTVVTSVIVQVGGRFETESETGMSHFLEHMAFKGTPTRSPKDITLDVEILGADINASTGKNATSYYITGLPEHIGISLDLLADVLRNSIFPENEIVSEKNVVCEEISESNDSINDVAEDALSDIAYPNQPMGRPILGSADNVNSFTRDMIVDYVGRFYKAGSMVVVGAGAVEHEAFVQAVIARFGDLPASERPKPVPAAYVGGEKRNIDTTYDQAHVYVGLPAPGRWEEDHAAYAVLCDILGTGMSAPLFQEVREKAALCYSVGSFLMNNDDSSLFIIGGSTNSEKVENFINASCAELTKIANGEIEESAWFRAQNQIRRQLSQCSDSLMMKASFLSTQIFGLGRVRSIAEIKDTYTRVTKEQVIAAARTLISSNPSVVVAGNAADVPYMPIVKAAFSA
jgi:predicted Zn-dependent peptidase